MYKDAYNAILEALKAMLAAYAPEAEQSGKRSGEASLHSAVRAARAALALTDAE